MSDLRELYQQVILDHNSSPRNFGPLEHPDLKAEGYNPLCGDRIQVEIELDAHGNLSSVGFTGKGCAICTASASMMTDGVRGKSRKEATCLFEAFHQLVTGVKTLEELHEILGKLAVFSSVREFPIRVKCATLPWHTLQAALAEKDETVTTE